mmetsp:Transcript_33602/g.62738  ORF Transcript_33602/g.62738 Transcript_33602/m.62738 type:complete len:307 (-) Transcript_33602:81-1001(-)
MKTAALTKFAFIATCCSAGQMSVAALVTDDGYDCASHPNEEVSVGERAMLQHSERRHTIGAEATAPIARYHANFTTNSIQRGVLKASLPPCECEAGNEAWKSCTRTLPNCVFIDLGAASGKTFQMFVNKKFGNHSSCRPGGGVHWQAILVEANPVFDQPLATEASRYPRGHVTTLQSTAAYVCDSQASFFIDTVNADNNYWGSSMSSNHQDVQKSNGQSVSVQTVNLNRILWEHILPDDYVIVVMDVEGAEFDILPCLANSPSANLIDKLYLNQHTPAWSLTGTTNENMELAKATLISQGVLIEQI